MRHFAGPSYLNPCLNMSSDNQVGVVLLPSLAPTNLTKNFLSFSIAAFGVYSDTADVFLC